jgi:hypothetical protein
MLAQARLCLLVLADVTGLLIRLVADQIVARRERQERRVW